MYNIYKAHPWCGRVLFSLCRYSSSWNLIPGNAWSYRLAGKLIMTCKAKVKESRGVANFLAFSFWNEDCTIVVDITSVRSLADKPLQCQDASCLKSTKLRALIDRLDVQTSSVCISSLKCSTTEIVTAYFHETVLTAHPQSEKMMIKFALEIAQRWVQFSVLCRARLWLQLFCIHKKFTNIALEELNELREWSGRKARRKKKG